MELYTDAASTVGFGGYFHGRYFDEPWPKNILTLVNDKTAVTSMAFMELYPIVVAAVIWGGLWKRHKVLFYCDNMATVQILT